MTRTKRKTKSVPCYAVLGKKDTDWLNAQVRINKFFRTQHYKVTDLAPKLKLDPLGWKVVEVRRYLPFDGCPITVVCRGHGYEVEVSLDDIQAANESLGLTNTRLITKVIKLLSRPVSEEEVEATTELADRFLSDQAKPFTAAQRTRILEGILLPVGRTLKARAADIVQRVGDKLREERDLAIEDVSDKFQDPGFLRSCNVGRVLNYTLTRRDKGRARSHPVTTKAMEHWKKFLKNHKWAAATYANRLCELGWAANAKQFDKLIALTDQTFKAVSDKMAINMMAEALIGACVGHAESRGDKVRWIAQKYRSKIDKATDGEFRSHLMSGILYR